MIRPPLQRLSDLEEALSREGIDPVPYGDLLARVRLYVRRYAELEQWRLGGIQVPIPRHLLDIDEPEEESGDALALVETLARRERARLAFGASGGRDVMSLLDRDGLKVYRPLFPPGGSLRGFFLFDEAVGPAFVADGRIPHAASNAVFARLYGHYLLDHDPYEIRTVSLGDTGRGARALRGEHFAVAFLIGREELLEYLAAAGWAAPRPFEAALLVQLSVYFEADEETVVGRLLSLGLLDAASIPDLPRLGSAAPAGAPTDASAVPERFVRLALEAHARGRLTAKELARDLETDLRSARRLAGQFEAGALDSEQGES